MFLESMAHLPVLPAEARRILDLARTDRATARKALAQHSAADQAKLLLETPISRRTALLDLVDQPEEVIPALPAADVCLMARSIGLEEAGWLLSCATDEQLQASVDIDAWDGFVPDQMRLREWLAAFADAGEETMLRATRVIDFEVLVLHLRQRAIVVLKTNEDDWEPPDGGQTIDGVFYFVPRVMGDDMGELLSLIGTLFNNEYWTYFRLAQGAIWEIDVETEEWAYRWRRGRMEDLGFPDPDDARRVYSFIRTANLADLPAPSPVHVRHPSEDLDDEEEDPYLPMTMPPLPTETTGEHAVFRAMAALPDKDRERVRQTFLVLANRVAMADSLPLGEPETLEETVKRAAELTSKGLEHLMAAHGLAGADVLMRVSLERLFQVGHQLTPNKPAKKDEADASS